MWCLKVGIILRSSKVYTVFHFFLLLVKIFRVGGLTLQIEQKTTMLHSWRLVDENKSLIRSSFCYLIFSRTRDISIKLKAINTADTVQMFLTEKSLKNFIYLQRFKHSSINVRSCQEIYILCMLSSSLYLRKLIKLIAIRSTNQI